MNVLELIEAAKSHIVTEEELELLKVRIADHDENCASYMKNRQPTMEWLNKPFSSL